MTTKTETEIKFKPLMNLTDANLVNQWWQNIKNVTRKHKVTDIDKEGKSLGSSGSTKARCPTSRPSSGPRSLRTPRPAS